MKVIATLSGYGSSTKSRLSTALVGRGAQCQGDLTDNCALLVTESAGASDKYRAALAIAIPIVPSAFLDSLGTRPLAPEDISLSDELRPLQGRIACTTMFPSRARASMHAALTDMGAAVVRDLDKSVHILVAYSPSDSNDSHSHNDSHFANGNDNDLTAATTTTANCYSSSSSGNTNGMSEKMTVATRWGVPVVCAHWVSACRALAACLPASFTTRIHPSFLSSTDDPSSMSTALPRAFRKMRAQILAFDALAAPAVHILCPSTLPYLQSARDASDARMVTIEYVTACVEARRMLDVDARMFYTPIKRRRADGKHHVDTETVICFSGFSTAVVHDEQESSAKKDHQDEDQNDTGIDNAVVLRECEWVMKGLGAVVDGRLFRRTRVLIVADADDKDGGRTMKKQAAEEVEEDGRSRKREMARKWGVPVVGVSWVRACKMAGQIVPVQPYVVAATRVHTDQPDLCRASESNARSGTATATATAAATAIGTASNSRSEVEELDTGREGKMRRVDWDAVLKASANVLAVAGAHSRSTAKSNLPEFGFFHLSKRASGVDDGADGDEDATTTQVVVAGSCTSPAQIRAFLTAQKH
eukprot:ANDGO_08003.mRNA.1 hypothetical protein